MSCHLESLNYLGWLKDLAETQADEVDRGWRSFVEMSGPLTGFFSCTTKSS